MLAHLRANLWLLVLTVLLCSVLYPGVLLVIGQTVFRDKAQGSLVTDAKGNPLGSRLIAQPFTEDRYFQPRPSAVAYNAAASGASNWSASNRQLRDRVARQLGPIVKYRSGPKAGRLVGPDVESWFHQQKIEPAKEGTDIQSAFFDMWLQAHPQVDLEPVPADMVMASGSGLDPHITLSNALWQLDRVAAAWAKQTDSSEAQVRQEITRLLRDHSAVPLGGLFGVPLVNVLEINLALRERYEVKDRRQVLAGTPASLMAGE
jgi:K+-transporting ATPase c subunit